MWSFIAPAGDTQAVKTVSWLGMVTGVNRVMTNGAYLRVMLVRATSFKLITSAPEMVKGAGLSFCRPPQNLLTILSLRAGKGDHCLILIFRPSTISSISAP